MSSETRTTLGCLGIVALVLVLLACAAALWVPELNARICLMRISAGSIPAKGETEFFYYNTYDDMIDTPNIRALMKDGTKRLRKQLRTEPFYFTHRTPENMQDERESMVWQLPGGYVCLTFGDWNDNDSIGLYAGEGQFLEKNKGQVYTPAQESPQGNNPAP